jgi:hypothetical protein
MPEDRPGSFQDGSAPPPAGHPGPNGSGPRPRELDRLPPPAFPPGLRGSAGHRSRRAVEARSGEGEGQPEGGVPDDAFISPDEPIVRTGSRIVDGAFISPDEPIPPRRDDDLSDVDPDQVVVTGIGDDPHLSAADLAVGRHEDPVVADLVARIGRLADAVREKGEAGLRTTPDMSRFEATIRAYCVGYLAAQREPRGE